MSAPERLDAFMARANAAYYATHDPFTDFTTAPEISQVFGEILGLWAAVSWQLLGSPTPVLLVEAGPGRGTLMVDALRAIDRAAPAFRAALQLHLIETSPRLQAIQAAVLPGAIWHAELETIPHEPLLLLANEFLDALPIRQFVVRGDNWTERFVGPDGFVECPVDAASTGILDADRRGEGPCHRPTSASRSVSAGGGGGSGLVIELCEPARRFVAGLGSRLAARPGAALFLDYGPERSAASDSLQAIAEGKPAPPLGPLGSADLTAHVDFGALGQASRQAGAMVHGPVPQGKFLTALGLFQRTRHLARGLPPRRAAALIDSAQRLAEPDRMGRLFKAMALTHPVCPIPPGFEG